jgi:hypothetical protein
LNLPLFENELSTSYNEMEINSGAAGIKKIRQQINAQSER